MPKAAAESRTVQLLAERAERDARRWEGAAVEMETQRNAALAAEAAALEEVEAMKAKMDEQARVLIEALDDLASRLAATYGIHLPARGCIHDDWPDK